MNPSAAHLVQNQNAYALVIGIGAYQNENISPLNFTRADAQGFYDLLTDPQRVGFPKQNVRLLLDGEATRTRILNSFYEWLFEEVTGEKDSTVMIFFAGHGGEELDKCDRKSGKKICYYLPWDANKRDLASTGISETDFTRLVDTLQSQRVVMFLDACHSGGLADGARDITLAGPKYEYSQLARGEGRAVIAASQREQLSWEDPQLQHGIFTYHLLEALRGKADANGDGFVSIREVEAYLEKEVPRSARRLGKAVQEPFFATKLTRDILLTVDLARVRELDEERQKAERARLDATATRRRQLLDLLNTNELPFKEYNEAMQLNEKSAEDFTPTERLLKDLLDSLLAGGIKPALYLATRAKIDADTGHFRRPPPLPPPRPPETRKPVFCIHCGHRNAPDNVFCFQCGKRLG